MLVRDNLLVFLLAKELVKGVNHGLVDCVLLFALVAHLKLHAIDRLSALSLQSRRQSSHLFLLQVLDHEVGRLRQLVGNKYFLHALHEDAHAMCLRVGSVSDENFVEDGSRTAQHAVEQEGADLVLQGLYLFAPGGALFEHSLELVICLLGHDLREARLGFGHLRLQSSLICIFCRRCQLLPQILHALIFVLERILLTSQLVFHVVHVTIESLIEHLNLVLVPLLLLAQCLVALCTVGLQQCHFLVDDRLVLAIQ